MKKTLNNYIVNVQLFFSGEIEVCGTSMAEAKKKIKDKVAAMTAKDQIEFISAKKADTAYFPIKAK
jgi:hypothetical protein